MSTARTDPETLDFDGLRIDFDDRVLRPRPWTAAQSRWAAEVASDAPAGPILELCSGAGHIGLLAARLAGRTLVCVDVDPVAAAYTLANAAANGLADSVEMRTGPLDAVLEETERFPVVVADPPWVPSAGTGRFPEDPLLAIDGGSDGLTVARACVDAIATHLATGGAAVLQLGTEQQAAELAAYAEGRLRLVETRSHGDRGVLALLRA